MITNRKYKDNLFIDLFHNKEALLELYNAIQGTNYNMNTEVKFITLENVLFTPQKNDLAALIDNRFVILMEHQSTLSENIPLRMFLYLAREYEKLVQEETLYKRRRVMIPTPELYVLYNGTEPCAEEMELRLSDAFLVPIDAQDIELKVKLININYQPHKVILERSEILHDYSFLIYEIRKQLKAGKTRDEAIKDAIQYCIEQGVLKEYLKEKSSEVYNMFLMEYDAEKAKKVFLEEGREEGREEGKIRMIVELYQDGTLNKVTCAEKLGMSLEAFEKLVQQQ